MSQTLTDDAQEKIATGGTLLDLLGDECSRVILATASSEPVTAKELTKRCDVSPATVYRRINTLVDNGVLRESFRFNVNSGRQKVYHTAFEHVDVDVNRDGFEVTPHGGTGGSYHLSRLLSELPFEYLNVDIDDNEVEVKIGLSGSSVDEFSDLWDGVSSSHLDQRD
jgi:DNA-binding Lrp family transcriptional regulator